MSKERREVKKMKAKRWQIFTDCYFNSGSFMFPWSWVLYAYRDLYVYVLYMYV